MTFQSEDSVLHHKQPPPVPTLVIKLQIFKQKLYIQLLNVT